MTQFLSIALLVVLAIAAVLFFVLKSQIKKRQEAEVEASQYKAACANLTDIAEGLKEKLAERTAALQTAQRQSNQITEDANEKRKDVNSAPDASLVDRANSLFGGVSNNKGSGN